MYGRCVLPHLQGYFLDKDVIKAPGSALFVHYGRSPAVCRGRCRNDRSFTRCYCYSSTMPFSRIGRLPPLLQAGLLGYNAGRVVCYRSADGRRAYCSVLQGPSATAVRTTCRTLWGTAGPRLRFWSLALRGCRRPVRGSRGVRRV